MKALKLKTIFSKPVETKAPDGSLAELSYDGVVRVTAARPASKPPSDVQVLTGEGVDGNPPSDVQVLTGEGVDGLTCTDPSCVGGTPPAVAWPQCSIEIQGGVVTPEHGLLLLLAGAASSPVAIPILDASLQGDALCQALSKFREESGMKGCVGFHIYNIRDAGGVADLAGKRIALAIALCTPV